MAVSDFTGGAGYPPRLERAGKLELTKALRSTTAAAGIPEGFRELKPGRVAPGGAEAKGHATRPRSSSPALPRGYWFQNSRRE